MNDESKFKDVGAWESVICAFIGLIIALFISLLFGIIVFVVEFPVPILMGLFSLFACAYFYGKLAGKLVYRFGLNSSKIWFIGIFLAWSCVITMAIIGSSYYFFAELKFANFERTFFDYIFKPLFWIVFFGFIPSTLLGLFWAKQVKKELSKLFFLPLRVNFQ